MRKILALLLTLTMILCLAGCQKAKPAETGEVKQGKTVEAKQEKKAEIPPKPQGPVTIKVSVAQKGDGFTALTDAAAAFNKSQSDYIVDLYFGGSYGEIRTIMQTSEMTDRPDIYASSGNDSAYYIAMEDKMYVPIQEFIDAEHFDDSNILNSLRTNYMRDGKWQCWPLGNTSVGQYFNTEVLGALGIDVKTLTSYEAIYEACEKIAAAGYKNFYYLRAIKHIDWLNYSMCAQGIPYFDADNGRSGVPTRSLYSEGKCKAATEAFFAFLRKMIDAGDWILDPAIGSSDAWIAFSHQDVLLMDGYVSGANSVISLVADSGKPFKWSYEVSPTIQAGAKNRGQSPGGGALFIAKTNNYWRQQGAWAFMKYLLRDEVVVDYALKTGYIPITKSSMETAVYKDYIQNKFPSAATTMGAMMATEEGIAYAPVPFSSQVNSIYKDICKRMLEDQSITPEEATAELASRVDEAISLYRISEGLD